MTPGKNGQLVAEHFQDTELLAFPSLQGVPGFVHVVTTKPWNMAAHRGPQSERAVERRRLICEHLGLEFDKLTTAQQIHSPHVVRVTPDDFGAGRFHRDAAIAQVDGLVCDVPGVPLLQLSADCPLILVVDPVRRAVGLAHSGWRGITARIANELVYRLQDELGSDPEDLLAAIAPCAGSCTYEVGPEVSRIVSSVFKNTDQLLTSTSVGRAAFNMPAAIRRQLIESGLREEGITAAGISTLEDERFYSHRREGPETGRFAVIAGFMTD